jgi:hypothetical protein
LDIDINFIIEYDRLQRDLGKEDRTLTKQARRRETMRMKRELKNAFLKEIEEKSIEYNGAELSLLELQRLEIELNYDAPRRSSRSIVYLQPIKESSQSNNNKSLRNSTSTTDEPSGKKRRNNRRKRVLNGKFLADIDKSEWVGKIVLHVPTSDIGRVSEISGSWIVMELKDKTTRSCRSFQLEVLSSESEEFSSFINSDILSSSGSNKIESEATIDQSFENENNEIDITNNSCLDINNCSSIMDESE